VPDGSARLWLRYATVFGALAMSGYTRAQTVTATVGAGSGPSFVAVNPVTSKVYVVNSSGNSVTVIDGTNNSTVTVATGTSPSSVAVNPVTNKIYIGNLGSSNVTVIDGATNSTSTVAAGSQPTSVAVNPVTNRIYVANNLGGAGSVTVIDGISNTTATVAVGLLPMSVAVNPVTNKIYVANFNSNNVTVIDGATNSTTTVGAGTGPQAVAINPATNKIYVANFNSNNVTVINGATNSTSTVVAGSRPTSVAVNPVTNRVYVANFSSNNVTVFDGATNNISTVAAGTGPQAAAVNPVTNKIYIANLNNSTVTVIDGATNSTATLTIGSGPNSVAVNPVTNKIYSANFVSNNVTVVDGATNGTATVAAGSYPFSVAANPVTNKIYVANDQSSNVTVIDGATNSTATVAVGSGPVSVAVNAVTNKIYVANYDSANVTVIDGATNATATVAATGTYPGPVAVNPVTNKIYVIVKGGSFSGEVTYGKVTVIDGVTNVTTTVAVGVTPNSLAVNPVTNKIYVANQFGDTVTVIDGATNATTTVAVGAEPVSIAVNPVTNKIYVANYADITMTVIDGATNATTNIIMGTHPNFVAVNPVTNKIYLSRISGYPIVSTVTVVDGATNATTNITAGTEPVFVAVNQVTNKIYVAISGNTAYDGTVMVIDGATNTASTVAAPFPTSVAVNPLTSKIYIANGSNNNVTVIDEQQVQPIPLTTSITPLPVNQTNNPTPSFTFTASSTTVAPPNAMFFQVDTWQNTWSTATGINPTFTGTLASLQPGFHILYAYAGDGQEATSTQPGSPLIGAIQAYGFLVTPPPATVLATIGTNPTGASFAVDGQSYASTQTFNWTIGSSHTIATTSPQAGPGGAQYVFTQWSDGGAIGHTVAAASNASYTASFSTQSGTPAAATYAGADTATQGTWTGKYGADGQLIANGLNNVPSYASFSFTGASSYTWSTSTSDVRALQTSSGSSGRISSTYYSYGFTIDLNLTDGNTHKISLYLCDWDAGARGETISIVDAASGVVLSTQAFNSFANGIYETWNIKGHVRIQVIYDAGKNAIVNALFFDTTGAGGGATATYAGSDATTQGTWTGKYGSDGQLIANGLNNIPSYASIGFTGAAAYTWTNSTSDARALQSSSGSSSRISSTYYSYGFTIDLNLTDGNTHKISLYLCDWDAGGRGETISIVDATSKAVLSTQAFNSFYNGVYATWSIKGHVQIQVIYNAGTNAVVNALFFDTAGAGGGAAATYAGSDATTQGTWTGKYGADGQLMANGLNNVPSYASISFAGASTYTWTTATSDARALQTSSGSASRISSTYYSYGFTIDLNLTDGNTHKISLYLCDWDAGGRGETISIVDATSKAVLDTETFASFYNGVYETWNIKGHVQIQVIYNTGKNAIMNAMFFDTGGTSSGATADGRLRWF
jgi:YVTN family beta-propeller protein